MREVLDTLEALVRNKCELVDSTGGGTFESVENWNEYDAIKLLADYGRMFVLSDEPERYVVRARFGSFEPSEPMPMVFVVSVGARGTHIACTSDIDREGFVFDVGYGARQHPEQVRADSERALADAAQMYWERGKS